MSNKNFKIKTEAAITCPRCEAKQKEKMPQDSCQYFYKCKHCGEVIRPRKGDCCVFCSYADTKCPSEQEEEKGVDING
ncbi:MAG: GDCCVxC domain-containing (seleno)protein [Patescibacteria group bacterium]